jgi:hypothetical protein
MDARLNEWMVAKLEELIQKKKKKPTVVRADDVTGK